VSTCTSRELAPDAKLGYVRVGDPCGHTLYLIGHAGKRRTPVEVCPVCDEADSMPVVREMRAA
jgi:hypothetical protein